MGQIQAEQIDSDSVILAPEKCDIYDADDMENGRWREDSGKSHCWRATAAYEMVGSTPSYIVPCVLIHCSTMIEDVDL